MEKSAVVDITMETVGATLEELAPEYLFDAGDSDPWGAVIGATFTACDALGIAAHDWGHYRLAGAISEAGFSRGMGAWDDAWTEWVDAGAPEPSDDNYDTWERYTMGAPFYRADAEADGVWLIRKLGQACRVLERVGASY